MTKTLQGYAALVVPQNHQAILSECAANFNKAILATWVDKHGPGGFFVRLPTEEDQPKNPLDCQLFTSDQFHQLFYFEKGDVDAMFRPIQEVK